MVISGDITAVKSNGHYIEFPPNDGFISSSHRSEKNLLAINVFVKPHKRKIKMDFRGDIISLDLETGALLASSVINADGYATGISIHCYDPAENHIIGCKYFIGNLSMTGAWRSCGFNLTFIQAYNHFWDQVFSSDKLPGVNHKGCGTNIHYCPQDIPVHNHEHTNSVCSCNNNRRSEGRRNRHICDYCRGYISKGESPETIVNIIKKIQSAGNGICVCCIAKASGIKDACECICPCDCHNGRCACPCRCDTSEVLKEYLISEKVFDKMGSLSYLVGPKQQVFRKPSEGGYFFSRKPRKVPVERYRIFPAKKLENGNLIIEPSNEISLEVKMEAK